MAKPSPEIFGLEHICKVSLSR